MLESQRLWRRRRADVTRPSPARLLVAAAIAVLAVGSGPALAQGSGPEKPPVKAPVSLRPEPAPVARAAPAPTVTTTAPASQASQTSPVTTSRPAGVVTATKAAPPLSAAIPSPKPPPPAPAGPKARKAVKSLAHAIQKSTNRLALGAPAAGSSDSNRLLFLGGLALVALVLGDAAFLAFSARAIREPAGR
jgi:hypothetical protein